MKTKVLVLLLLILSVQLFGERKTIEGDLKIAGGTAHLKFMKTLSKGLMKDNPNLRISIEGGGSGVGIKKVGENLVDIGNSGRDLKQSEIETYGLIPHKIAIDGIAIIVNNTNKINDLSFEQIQLIFSGEITNWKDVGGEDKNINLYSRDSESGTRKTFVKLALKKGKISQEAIIVNSNGNMKTAVSQDEHGIGYMSVGYLDKSIKGVAIEGIKPTLESVKNGSYKIQRYLYSITKGQPTGTTKIFLDLLLSEKGQKIISDYHFIPVK